MTDPLVSHVPIPESPRGKKRLAAFVALNDDIKNTNINMFVKWVRAPERPRPKMNGLPFVDEDVRYLEAIRVEFYEEKDYLLFQLQFGDHPIAKGITRDIVGNRRRVARKRRRAQTKAR